MHTSLSFCPCSSLASFYSLSLSLFSPSSLPLSLSLLALSFSLQKLQCVQILRHKDLLHTHTETPRYLFDLFFSLRVKMTDHDALQIQKNLNCVIGVNCNKIGHNPGVNDTLHTHTLSHTHAHTHEHTHAHTRTHAHTQTHT